MNIKTTSHAAYDSDGSSAQVTHTDSNGGIDATPMMLLERAVLQADWRMLDQRDEWV